jgi:hypothetical protein
MAVFYAFLIAMTLQFLVIHQWGAVGMIGGDPTLAKPSYVSFMADYGTAFRTFKHGLLHGFIAGFFCLHYQLLEPMHYSKKEAGNTL